MRHSLLFVVLSSESLSIIAITLSSNFRDHSQASRCFTADVCLRQSVNQLYNNQKWPNLFFFPLLVDHCSRRNNGGGRILISEMSAGSGDEDDVPALSAETFSALQEFYKEQVAKGRVETFEDI